MRGRTLALLAACVTLWVGPAGLPAEAGAPLDSAAGLKNFHRVSEAVYRSAQPGREQFQALVRDYGIRSVLDLRLGHGDGEKAKGLGLALYRVPMRAGHIEDEDILRAMRVLLACPKPVLVHCRHGSDRTGCVVAVYRMVFQGWSGERAIAELKAAGFGYHEGLYPNIEAYLRHMDVDRLRRELRPAAPATAGARPETRVASGPSDPPGTPGPCRDGAVGPSASLWYKRVS